MGRAPAILVLIVAMAAIVFGRVSRRWPVAVVGFVLLAAAFVLARVARS